MMYTHNTKYACVYYILCINNHPGVDIEYGFLNNLSMLVMIFWNAHILSIPGLLYLCIFYTYDIHASYDAHATIIKLFLLANLPYLPPSYLT